MVSAALNITAEVVESINHGIRVPAQKIAQAATQAKNVVEGLLERIKGMAGNTPFGGQKRQQPKPASAYPSSGAPFRSASPASGSSGTPTTPTGSTYAAAPKDL